MPLSKSFAEWDKYRKEKTIKKVKKNVPAKGIRGWMGAEDTIIEEKEIPTERAKIVIDFQSNLSSEARQQFDNYFEAKTAGASETVLKEAEKAYQEALNKEKQREVQSIQNQQKMTDEYYLQRIRAAKSSTLTIQ